ncbi:hypothetical protein KTAU_01030 [Thermogemmatispora aurantia]|uniref:Uncharacterized protein n=1 Tax=Thermogemmatispora aurantia TaxID=2045279 RepID=A0A5J4JUP4_9CHLR|nr:hypothetical protein KTAU_01030 [Thermogemmatispora aurantia]
MPLLRSGERGIERRVALLAGSGRLWWKLVLWWHELADEPVWFLPELSRVGWAAAVRCWR